MRFNDYNLVKESGPQTDVMKLQTESTNCSPVMLPATKTIHIINTQHHSQSEVKLGHYSELLNYISFRDTGF
jgi:hypothetical protein